MWQDEVIVHLESVIKMLESHKQDYAKVGTLHQVEVKHTINDIQCLKQDILNLFPKE